MKNVTARAEVDRVAGIVAALITSSAVEALGKNIDDLSLSFVTPLGPDNREILAHCLNVYPQGSSISSRSFGTRG